MVASRTLDPRVVRVARVVRVVCTWDTKNRRSLLLGVYAGGSKRPQSGYISVTSSKL